MNENIKYKIIDTMRSVGLEKINKEKITRNNILDIVSSYFGMSRQDIKSSVNYKKIISDELGKMEEDEDSDNEPLSIIASRMQSLKLGKTAFDMDSGDRDNEYGGVEETKETNYIGDTIDEDVVDIDFNPQYREILRPGVVVQKYQ